MTKEHDHPGIATYAIVWILLLGAAAASLTLSRLGVSHAVMVAASMAVGLVKAFVVLWFFMHLSEARFPSRVVISVAALLFILLVSLIAADPITRVTYPYKNVPTDNAGFYKSSSDEAKAAAREHEEHHAEHHE